MIYRLINFVVLLIALFLFLNKDLSIYNFLSRDLVHVIIIFIISVTSVHIIKAIRLYLALYGNGIKGRDFIKTYCKVTPVNVILPFKIGELFRIYCWGHLLKDYLKSTIVILLDRFMDTIAIITILLCFFNSTKISGFIHLFILFSLVLILIYFMFPNFYRFWKDYFLNMNATKNKIFTLRQLEKINKIYIEINNIIKGKGIILYALSIVAWAIEIINLILLNKLCFNTGLNNIIHQYLNAALGNGSSVEFLAFVFLSVVILALIYMVLQVKSIYEVFSK